MREHPAHNASVDQEHAEHGPQYRNGPGSSLLVQETQCPELSNQYNWPDTLYHPLWAMIPFFCK